MKSYDFGAVAYDGAVYCCECAPDVDECELSPVFADGEWDSYPVCDSCGAVHYYVSLTTEGQNYEDISAAIAQHRDGEFDGLAVGDLSEVPDEYEGAVLQVNDHGNITLWDVEDGEYKEIASRV